MKHKNLYLSCLLVVIALAAFGGGVKDQKEQELEQKKMDVAVGVDVQARESPILAELVKAGKLPTLEKRLPEEPLVVEPIESLGLYGGTWHRINYRVFANWYYWEPLIKLKVDDFSPIPNIAKECTISDDYSTFTFKIRKGIKWSDGQPFTVDDVIFWYEDILKNDEMMPSKPHWLLSGGKLVDISAPDDTTIVFKFAGPKMLFLREQAQMERSDYVRSPKHYLKQFHPKYTNKDELDKKLKEANMDSWVQLMATKMTVVENPDLPILGAWALQTDPSAELQVAERNPFYWKVDTAGRQLPYIDEMVFPLKADAQVTLMKAIAGEVDFDRVSKIAGDMIVLRKSETSGNYRTVLLDLASQSNALVLHVNQNYQGDPEIAEMLKKVTFRRALSVAIDREELIEFTVLGLAEPRQAVLSDIAPGGDTKFSKAYIEYDPEKAKRWLDEAGLKRLDKDGYRVLPSGKSFLLILSPDSGRKLSLDSAEIIKKYFEAVGIRTVVKPEDGALHITRRSAGEHMITIGNNGEGVDPLNKPYEYFPLDPANSHWAPLNAAYYVSDGKNGIKPTGLQQELLELYEKASIELNETKRVALYRRTMELHSENLWQIGTMSLVGFPIVISNRMRNVPEKIVNAYQNAPAFAPEQFYIKE